MPVKSVLKKIADLDLKNSAYFASQLLENNRYKTPDKFYFSPNQSIDSEDSQEIVKKASKIGLSSNDIEFAQSIVNNAIEH